MLELADQFLESVGLAAKLTHPRTLAFQRLLGVTLLLLALLDEQRHSLLILRQFSQIVRALLALLGDLLSQMHEVAEIA